MNKSEQKLTKEQRKKIYSISIVIAAVAMLLLGYILFKPFLAFGSDSNKFRDWINSYGSFSRLVFTIIIVLQVVIAVIPGEPFELLAGYCFGAFEGTMIVLIGIVVGSIIVYMLVNKVSKDFVNVFFDERQINRLDNIIRSKKMELIVFFLNVLPGTPKDLLTYFVGFTNLELKTWLLIISIARIPSVLSSALIGSGTADKNYPLTITISVITIVASLVGMLIYYKISAKNTREERRNDE